MASLPLRQETDAVYAPAPSLMARSLAVAACVASVGLVYYTSTSSGAAMTASTELYQTAATVRPATTAVAYGAPSGYRRPLASGIRQASVQPIQQQPAMQLGQAAMPFPEPPVAPSIADTLYSGGPWLGLWAVLGSTVGVGLVALYQHMTGPNKNSEHWSMAAVAADADMDLEKMNTEKPLPPYAEGKPFRPDLFQPKGKGQVILSDVKYEKKRNYWFNRAFNPTDKAFVAVMLVLHGMAFGLGPATYSPECLALAFGMYIITGMFGITLSFHRQLSHRSFQTPKWLEYIFAYCGVLAIQGDPIEWISSHRHHHQYCETDRDPHTPNEGLWWSHMGWLLDHEASKSRTEDQSNATDMTNDKFYVFLQKTYPLHIAAHAAMMYAWGGLPYLVWGVAVRCVWVYHITWFVNSAAHVWGNKQYRTTDESRNNWWVGILAFGEGWHNNHHAFQFSARHGLEWYQWDPTWYTIRALQFVGLARNVKLPSEQKKASLRLA